MSALSASLTILCRFLTIFGSLLNAARPRHDWLNDQAGLDEFAECGTAHLEIERRHATKICAVGLTYNRPSARPGFDAYQSVHLEDAQRLSQ